MKLSLLLRTQEFRGDHAADITIAHEVIDGETVQALAQRLLGAGKETPGDVIEIRKIKDAEIDSPF